ncbi:helix-turn-helix domain-containing protein [Clostridium culturomicium]|uniref:helix-turn-helix domain-containing protein n=1 Tax=Clostridium culturomicium TaxID=1499683 RepID=UPI0005A6BEE0|nr:helix-turn-helix transcriptional regulator [Clostridium culturomicium]
MVSILGENIKHIREEKNLSVNELSRKAKVGVATISQIETGKRQGLRSETLEKIAIALEVTTNDLLNINEYSYEISDLSEAIDFILSDDEISIDNIQMTQSEKEQFKFAVDMAINTIRKNRQK